MSPSRGGRLRGHKCCTGHQGPVDCAPFSQLHRPRLSGTDSHPCPAGGQRACKTASARAAPSSALHGALRLSLELAQGGVSFHWAGWQGSSHSLTQATQSPPPHPPLLGRGEAEVGYRPSVSLQVGLSPAGWAGGSEHLMPVGGCSYQPHFQAGSIS